MIKFDEDSLICDLAETYQIYDYKRLPPRMVAVFSLGLPSNSRIKMKMNGFKIPLNEMLLASMVDSLNILIWTKTKDGQKGKNQPKSVFNLLVNDQEESKVETFDSGKDFELSRQRILNEIRGGN